MNWIKVATKMRTSVSVRALSRDIGKDMGASVGYVVCVLLMLPDHARDGDLSQISDDDIEEWALWRGKPGKFAPAFVAHLCTPQRVVRVWDLMNGAAIRASDQAKDRVKRWREERKANADVTRNVQRTLPVTYEERTPLRDGTGRDVQLTTMSDADAPAVPKKSKRKGAKPVDDAAFPHFPIPDRQAAFATWTRKRGSVGFSRLVLALGPCWPAPDDANRPTGAALLWALDLYCTVIAEGRSAPFGSIEKAAEVLVALARLQGQYSDPIARHDAAYQMLHGHRQGVAA